MPSHLGLITIQVRNMPATKAFYTEILGYEILKEFSSPAEDFLILHSKANNTSIALQDANVINYGIPEGHGSVILGFLVEDADAVYQDWKTKSIEILGEVGDMGAGRMFNAKDPDGNYIQVYHFYPEVLEMQKQMGLL